MEGQKKAHGILFQTIKNVRQRHDFMMKRLEQDNKPFPKPVFDSMLDDVKAVTKSLLDIKGVGDLAVQHGHCLMTQLGGQLAQWPVCQQLTQLLKADGWMDGWDAAFQGQVWDIAAAR